MKSVALAFLLATPLFGQLQFGPPLSFADVPEGAPYEVQAPISSWSDNGVATAVIYRGVPNGFQHSVMRIGIDGRVDPASLLRLPMIQSDTFDVTRFRNGMMAAWDASFKIAVAPLDRNGVPLAATNNIPIRLYSGAYGVKIVCDDDACLVRFGNEARIVDQHGSLVAKLDGYFQHVAAGPHQFFAERCANYNDVVSPPRYSDCSVQLVGDDGATLQSAPRPREIHDVIFDGRRYVELSAAAPGQFEIDTIDPAGGKRAKQWTGPPLPHDESNIQARLAWNGGTYLLAAQLWAPDDVPLWYEKPRLLAAMRFTASFLPLDPAMVTISTKIWQRRMPADFSGAFDAVGTADGFRVLWLTEETNQVRT